MIIHMHMARKSKKVRKCKRCGTEICAGRVYYWVKHRNMPIECYCSIHKPTARDLTISNKLRSLYDAQESISNAISIFENNVDVSESSEWQGTDSPVEPDVDDDNPDKESLYSDWEASLNEWEDNRAKYQESCKSLDSALADLVSELESAEGNIREVADGYHESADNQEEYFPGSPKVDEIREKGDKAEEWADALNYAASAIESLRGEIDEDSPEESRSLTDIVEEAVSSAQSALDEGDF